MNKSSQLPVTVTVCISAVNIYLFVLFISCPSRQWHHSNFVPDHFLLSNYVLLIPSSNYVPLPNWKFCFSFKFCRPSYSYSQSSTYCSFKFSPTSLFHLSLSQNSAPLLSSNYIPSYSQNSASPLLFRFYTSFCSLNFASLDLTSKFGPFSSLSKFF